MADKLTNQKKIADAFNNHFVDYVERNTQFDIKSSYKYDIRNNNYDSLFLTPVTPPDIFKIIKSLKNTNSVGYDGISTKVIKDVAIYITPVVTHICNLCLEQGIFPQQLKKNHHKTPL